VDKSNKTAPYDPFITAWQALIQRFENTLSHSNFPGPKHGLDYGMILPDHTDAKKLTGLMRQMRHYNPVPNLQQLHGTGYRNLALNYLTEDPYFKDSAHSYFLQAVDCVCYMHYQQHAPCSYIRKKAGRGYFHRLKVVLSLHASLKPPHCTVYL
jgi:hypothetical protein